MFLQRAPTTNQQRFLAGRSGSARFAAQQQDDVLDIEDVIGKRMLTHGLHSGITIREENAIAALEVMSRFAVDPKWLIYLPPTMSPSETTNSRACWSIRTRRLPTTATRDSRR